jgi:hypothetical protein
MRWTEPSSNVTTTENAVSGRTKLTRTTDLVDQTGASWNQLVGWLQQLDNLRAVG